MNEEKNIHYSAADIERYHKGLMTAKERHSLEKAALDDPFLADAMEGYAVAPTATETDVALLNKKLDERIGKVVPLKKTGFIWLRIAAAVILVGGAGLLTYNFVFTKNKNEVAKIESNKAPEKKDTVTNNAVVAGKTKDSLNVIDNKSQQTTVAEKGDVAKSNNENNKMAAPPAERHKTAVKVKSDEQIKTNAFAPPQTTQDVAVEKQEETKKTNADTVTYHDNLESTAVATKPQTQGYARLSKEKDKQPQFKSQNEPAVARGIAAQNNITHIFRGQVMDQNNNPLPFANVTIMPDNIGTYTDAKGYFTLISGDSALNVQVRSVGFENKTASLQTKLANNSIVLDQDTKNIPSTVISNRKINADRKRMGDNVKLEEPEPADGWYNYDTYIANNIKISDEIKMKTNATSEVELSFDVDKLGEPVNIKVEKSVCKECDEEAIRLLKEGPKWKKKKKNRRATVSVAFR